MTDGMVYLLLKSYLLESGDEDGVDLHGGGDVHGGGVGVIAALALVDVVIGVDRGLAAQLPAQQLDGSVGDDLVCVHVGLGAGARLPDDEGEVVIIQLSCKTYFSVSTSTGRNDILT